MAGAEETVVNRKDLNPEGSPQEAFGARLRGAREKRGLTQDELAERMGYTGRHVSAVETGRKPPTRRFAAGVDTALGTKGTGDTFERACGEIRHGVLLEGFPEYLSYEGRAVEIRVFEVGVIPGLLQTPGYVRALADAAVYRGDISDQQADEWITLLAERQAALIRPVPPALVVIMDESCIRRPVGGWEVMNEQLDRLAEVATLPHAMVLIAPYDIGERRTFNRPVNLLTLADRSVMSYVESQTDGRLEREVAAVAPLFMAYHQLQKHTLPLAASVDLIKLARKGSL
ncbi:helix-turn-helix transcriptional regulator [Streptomyces sp. NPDC020875]|uniref:helix-turn-helix domain-containing protein n=1 Tax=Streptomyces sp. NPDC020875 TaxID=3154898 RepID=UPI003403AAB2